MLMEIGIKKKKGIVMPYMLLENSEEILFLKSHI